MPHVIVKLYAGRSERQKAKLAAKITTAVMASVNCGEQAVSVKPVRGPLPAHLPRERVVLPSPTSCPCCGGKLVKLGEAITESLESISA